MFGHIPYRGPGSSSLGLLSSLTRATPHAPGVCRVSALSGNDPLCIVRTTVPVIPPRRVPTSRGRERDGRASQNAGSAYASPGLRSTRPAHRFSLFRLQPRHKVTAGPIPSVPPWLARPHGQTCSHRWFEVEGSEQT
jgi:hypothetical protein